MNTAGMLDLDDFRRACQGVLDAARWSYLAGGAGHDDAVRENEAALRRLRLRPRPLNGVADPDLTVDVLGFPAAMPVLLAPTSPLRLFHPDAELAVSRAARRAGVLPIVSNDSHHSLTEIAKQGPCWFQLYCYGSRADVVRTIRLAESVDARALVVTIDNSHPSRRVAMLRSGFATPPEVEFGIHRESGFSDGAVPPDTRLPRWPLTWELLDLIRSQTRLPVVVKGVLHPADAALLTDRGVAGLIVSNHGGRQLNDSIAAIDALPGVVAAAAGRLPVLLDGGIRTGGDVVKALAAGAAAVCLGRPYVWGLTLDGEDGVLAVLELLRAELLDVARQTGLRALRAVPADLVAPPPPSFTGRGGGPHDPAHQGALRA
ncbi:(S)-2-hydroxy-acid oxidase [Actinoplanes sp. SE50]|uniref:alpha-hydroxy acid oxidase n=1 Tax=unclassified Actinoplanes TaxID=2626549 RepID=UPI00023EC5C2|nr:MULTISPECIES: alpha-hydroxy acid oxidase [unclassified Actinoplanes]AEV83083.1 (S)-2-hydroxy-acid oxidase [Actinoplanes sp. SE50/110]ATO81479.1 (S)-2-hydroxy-acid oxidase [Actinoplanes sp. SE50]SLL98886.1 alpha-hydroxy-acid oxidizing enzyme [Actinoplanes sp. SE50/110]